MTKRLKQLREDARACQACPLWANATQTVFGAGDPHARVMLVGEQPGDEEDLAGPARGPTPAGCAGRCRRAGGGGRFLL